ncbi:uncharacterized protein LOC129597254 [Paramacrobiotus metropolitanus]|uniref:uncharacterized protein LOC129597254 n=1 Tax=Paramacrobiotus metropolitanus TaxID=2943436 RepID=UPI0024458C74|nr:uncharacterized protein LOC129597254 [Paramacrobiotus metropolitanus]
MTIMHIFKLWTVIQLCGCCSPSQKESLDEIIEKGLSQHRQGDLTILQFDPSWEAAAQQRPFSNQEVMQRPHLGDNVTFACELPPGTHWHTVSWLHQDRVVFERGQPVPVEDGQEYSFSRMDDVMLFRISSVSFLASGAVTCVKTVEPNIPIKRYYLLPLVTRASQVFYTPMPDQLVTEGDTLTVACALRLPLSPEAVKNNFPLNHVMWRHNSRLLSTPVEAPYSHLTHRLQLSAEMRSGFEAAKFLNRGFRSPLIVTTSIPNISAASGKGAVECWFRPHAGLHEWIVQKAKILVQSRMT